MGIYLGSGLLSTLTNSLLPILSGTSSDIGDVNRKMAMDIAISFRLDTGAGSG